MSHTLDRYSVGDAHWFEGPMSRTGTIEKMTTWLGKGAAAAPDGRASRES